MITAPKISINLPPFKNCGSSSSSAHDSKVSNVSITDTKANSSVTRIINKPTVVVETPTISSNIVRRHSFRKENNVVHANVTNFIEGSIEQSMLRSNVPISLSSEEEITVNGHRGIWANRNEVLNWNGPVPISQYRLNDDPYPEVIHKTNNQPIEYTQEIQVRYLRPPTPPTPGDLIIKQEGGIQVPPAPPQIIRQHAPRPVTPEPLIIREAPPEPPAHLPRKVITISGQNVEPPPRKVIIEKLPPLPPKPQPVIIERWLPYQQQKRRVIYESANNTSLHQEKPRNIIIQWEAPNPVIKKNIKYLGVENAEPRDYVSKFGNTLKRTTELPSFVRELETDGQNTYKKITQDYAHELEGDIEAFKFLDVSTIEREGLSMYKHYLNNNNNNNNYGQHTREIITDHLHSSVITSSPEYSNLGGTSQHSIGISYNNDNHSTNLRW